MTMMTPIRTGQWGKFSKRISASGHGAMAATSAVALGEYRIGPETLVSAEKLGEGEPDEQEAEGYTGNAGCTMDYWYRRAAMVLWAASDDEGILCRYDFRGACGVLKDLAVKGEKGPRIKRLGEALIEQYHESPDSRLPYHRVESGEGHPFVLILGAIARTGSRGLLDRFLATIEPAHFVLCDRALWRKLFDAFGLEPLKTVGRVLVADGTDKNRRAIFQLMDALRGRRDGEAEAALLAARTAALDPAKPVLSTAGIYHWPATARRRGFCCWCPIC